MARKKGPSWNDAFDPKQANRIEKRSTGGYLARREEMGRTRVQLRCPFCKNTFWAYVWSLAGGGKRCDCGALTGGTGDSYHFADRGQT